MTIYNINGTKLLDAILTEGGEHEEELGKTNLVRLSWNSDKKVTLPAGAYIIPFNDGLKYRLLDTYTPSEDSKQFKYAPEFHHPLMILSRVPFLYSTTDQSGTPVKQQDWSFDGLTATALQHVCDAINEAFGFTTETDKFTYTLCGTVDGSVNFSVSSNDILSVISLIAQACKSNSCEGHLSWEHRTLYFGQVSVNLGEDVPLLKVHGNLQVASVTASKEAYYNCFYPQGSTKNMSSKAQVGTGNVATLARLCLNTDNYPDGCIYIGTDGKIIPKPAFDASNAVRQTLALSFDDVYPHINLYAYNIRKRTQYVKNGDTGEYMKDKVFTIWYMRLAYCTTEKDATRTPVNTTTDKDEQGKPVTHYWYDYELDPKKQVLQGHSLMGTFKVNTHTTNNQYDALTQALVGQPNGQDGFEFAYHEKSRDIPANSTTGDSGVSVQKGDYEIIKYQSGDVIIPSNEEDGLIPRGNRLPDLTCNIVILFNIVMGEYETTLAQEELATRTIKEIERRTRDNNNYTAPSNAVEFEKKNPNLYIGQQVTYDDGQGYQLSTRVIKLVTKLDYPIIQEITVGNQAVKGNITQLKEDVKNILSGNFSGGGLNERQVSDIIRNYTGKHFLSKLQDDTARGLITFLKGLVAQAVSYFKGIVNNGNIINTGDIVTRNLRVTEKATFFQLEIQKAKAAGGMTVHSAGTFHIDAVEEATDTDGYVCYQRAEQDGVKLLQRCEVSDQMMCSNGMNILKGGKGNHFYWRKVTDAPKEVVTHTINGKEEKCLKIVLSKTDHSKNTVDIPQVGDDLVQIGNPDNKERQSVIMTCAYNSFDPDLEAPYWVQYTGVKNYELSKYKRTWFAANGSQVTGNFKVQSDNGGEESIEDYMKGLASDSNMEMWNVSFSIRNITGKQGETFSLKVVRIVGDKAEEVDGAALSAAGADLLLFSDDMGMEIRVQPGVNYLTANYGYRRYLVARVVRNDSDVTLAQDTIYAEAMDGKPGKDAVSYKLIPIQEAAVAYKAENGDKLVRLLLKYKVQKTVGEVTQELALGDEGITLSVVGITETFVLTDGAYVLDKKNIPYKEENIETYVVTLTKGSNIVDQRIVPITFKPSVVFDIDTVNGTITSQIEAANGKINSVERDLNQTKATVGDLNEQYTQLNMKSDAISLTVNNGTRPNLLWGSDLDLSEVQNKIQLAYDNGNIIKQKTAKKEDLQRQLDATPTNDTAKRNDLQKQINDCNNEINTARNRVNECKVAIEKHLGVKMEEIKVDSKEYFQHLKGGGVAGSDALMFKSKDGVARWTNIKWEKIKVKPNTVYTMSAWVKFKPNKEDVNQIYVGVIETESSQGLAFMEGSDNQYYLGEINQWERRHWTFKTNDKTLLTVLFAHSGTDESLMWLCRPKLEESDKATPWCEYDGTVEALLASGLDIKNRKMIATTDNFMVQNNKGEWTFLLDENGHINAKLISAESITAQKIAQPFVEQKSFDLLMTSPSLSWYITKGDNINGRYVLASELNGAVLNIYNYTTETIWFYSTLAAGKTTHPNKTLNVRVEIEPGAMFRAIGVPIEGVEMATDNGTTTLVALVPLVPMELTSLSGDMRAKYIGVVKGFLTIR
ncbi:hypothetical protein HMPREF0645_2631 [Hallella bergensis DSM 17361]|uniref:Uncharacterized protein n=2 Tax=Hallella bergensis TaxID=242750 RepID=D1Q096_9BACT|nr:hypothetical protein HMPREF0645_2631 [Hallella bergensis DSM 17361]